MAFGLALDAGSDVLYAATGAQIHKITDASSAEPGALTALNLPHDFYYMSLDVDASGRLHVVVSDGQKIVKVRGPCLECSCSATVHGARKGILTPFLLQVNQAGDGFDWEIDFSPDMVYDVAIDRVNNVLFVSGKFCTSTPARGQLHTCNCIQYPFHLEAH